MYDLSSSHQSQKHIEILSPWNPFCTCSNDAKSLPVSGGGGGGGGEGNNDWQEAKAFTGHF